MTSNSNTIIAPGTPAEGKTRDTSSLTKTLITLHWRLLRNSLATQKSQWVMIIMVFLYGMMGALQFGIMALFSFNDLGSEEQITNPHNLVIGLAIGVPAYWLLAVAYPTSENQLTPSWFAPLPVDARKLLPGFMWAALLQSRGLLVVINSCITFLFGMFALILGDHENLIPLFLIAVCVAGVLSIAGAEALVVISSGGGMVSKVKQEKMNRYGMIGMVVLLIVFVVLSNSLQGDTLMKVSRILAWLPSGAGAGAVAAFAEGNTGEAIAKLVIAIILVPFAIFFWHRGLRNSLACPLDGFGVFGERATRTSGGIIFRGLKPSALTAIVSNQLLYLRRDSRWFGAITTLPMMTIVFILMGKFMHNQTMYYTAFFFVPVTAAQSVSNLFGFDGPSNWVHLVTGVKAKTIIRARTLIFGVFGVCLGMVALPLAGFFQGFDAQWGIWCVMSLGALPAALGIGALLSVINPFPTARPGTNYMKDRSGYSGNAWVTALLLMVVMWLPLAPGFIAMGVAAAGTGSIFWYAIGQAWVWIVSIAIGIVTLRLAEKKLATKWPEIFYKVNHYV